VAALLLECAKAGSRQEVLLVRLQLLQLMLRGS
jgi:hypothetical protein